MSELLVRARIAAPDSRDGEGASPTPQSTSRTRMSPDERHCFVAFQRMLTELAHPCSLSSSAVPLAARSEASRPVTGAGAVHRSR
jgi:hypothetical protein